MSLFPKQVLQSYVEEHALVALQPAGEEPIHISFFGNPAVQLPLCRGPIDS